LKNKLICLLAILLLPGCSPKVIMNGVEVGNSNARIGNSDNIEVLFRENALDIEKTPVAEIEIKDNGLSIGCSLDKVLELAKDNAKSVGGNLILITEHLKPDRKSSCHRIKGEIYNVEDPTYYNSKIIWTPERPIKISDFLASTENRPFQATTYSGFGYEYYGKSFAKTFTIKVEVYFDKELSYFKTSEHDADVLKHEQLHFDISELYARKLISRINNEIKTFFDWEQKNKIMFDEVYKELTITQDKYDSEVYADRTKQEYWNAWVSLELEKYPAQLMQKIIINRK
jgi:hypothetical protein